MTRLARVVVPNCPHHITQRGVRSIDIFANDNDRIKYLNLLKKSGEKCMGLSLVKRNVPHRYQKKRPDRCKGWYP